MAGAIVLFGKTVDRNPAPVQSYADLYNALDGQIRPFFVVNGGGECIGPSSQINRDFTPERIAQFVKDGNVFVDYCGWPMYYQADTSGNVATVGASGFGKFASYLGYGWLDKVQFAFPTFFNEYGTTFPFTRGFPLAASLDGVCYSVGSMATPALFGFLGGGSLPITADGYTAMFALHPPGGGWYFYATYAALLKFGIPFTAVDSMSSGGVAIADYAAFIQTLVNGGSNANYVCQPYHLSSLPATTVTPGPSSPFSGGGGSSSPTVHTTTSGGGTSGGTSGGTTASTTCANGYEYVNGQCVQIASSSPKVPSWAKPVAGAGALVLGGTLVYLVGSSTGWWSDAKPKPEMRSLEGENGSL